MTGLICAACQKPIRTHDFYVKALRGDETDDEHSFLVAGTHTVHVPNCPGLSTQDAYALAGVDYEAAMRNDFKRVPPRDPLATTERA